MNLIRYICYLNRYSEEEVQEIALRECEEQSKTVGNHCERENDNLKDLRKGKELIDQGKGEKSRQLLISVAR